MVARLIALLAVVALALAGCGSDEPQAGGALVEDVKEQLAYLDPASSAVVVVDLRYDGGNWDDLKPLVDRVLGRYRETVPPGQRQLLPETTRDALEQVVGFAKLSFAEDVEPALDGRLVIGVVMPPGGEPQITAVYRTSKGDLRAIAEKMDEDVEPRRVPGTTDAVVVAEGAAIVGRKTLVASVTGDDADVKAAMDRAKDGSGFPEARLTEAMADVGDDDPLVLATGDLTLARALVEEKDLESARESVPYLRALSRGSASVDVKQSAVEATVRLATDAATLSKEDLPVAPAGDVALPKAPGAITGGSRDQSYTTTFGARLARALFPDSRFVKAVERAEKDLGIRFEEEVLAQFDCPSVSILEPSPDLDAPMRFGARSCVRDPKRMRALLPRLRPHLPAILEGLEGLQEEGLTALLLLAPDAPLTPATLLAGIDVRPAGELNTENLLYVVDGLKEPSPPTVVFGLVGDVFAVASDEVLAMQAAELETEELDDQAASALRVPVAALLRRNTDDVSDALAGVFGDLVATVSADPKATTVKARLELSGK